MDREAYDALQTAAMKAVKFLQNVVEFDHNASEQAVNAASALLEAWTLAPEPTEEWNIDKD